MIDVGPGIPLGGDEPVPDAVAEALNVDGAPFRPSTGDPTNSNRLMAIASALLLTTDDIKTAMSLYEGHRSDELAEVHMQNVADRLLLLWACQQKNAEEKPLFESIEEAQSFMDSHDRQPQKESARIVWWKNVVQKQAEAK